MVGTAVAGDLKEGGRHMLLRVFDGVIALNPCRHLTCWSVKVFQLESFLVMIMCAYGVKVLASDCAFSSFGFKKTVWRLVPRLCLHDVIVQTVVRVGRSLPDPS